MQSISTSDIKFNTKLLQNALTEDIVVTKQDKPYVVVIDYDRYIELTQNHSKKSDWIEKSFGVMSKEDADNLLEDINNSRVDKEIDLWS
jgi:hypothetical protein